MRLKLPATRRFALPLAVQYLALVVLYIAVLPLAFQGASAAAEWLAGRQPRDPRYEATRLEADWHALAAALTPLADAEKVVHLTAFQAVYPDATLWWVDAAGRTRWHSPGTSVPASWSAPEVAALMKRSYGGDPFTVVALLGPRQDAGLLVLQLPRRAIWVALPAYAAGPFLLGLGAALFLAFAGLSWLFFWRVSRRLARLQRAMHAGPPQVLVPSGPWPDEITRLEQDFNAMVAQLAASRAAEVAAEHASRQLIAGLSHDLRTPLTVVRSQAYTLQAEPLSPAGREALAAIDAKVVLLDRLLDSLLTLTRLTAGALPCTRQPVELTRAVRAQLAGWYPAFEQAGFNVEVDLPATPVWWHIDPLWLQRILDNLLQNVLRHAAGGTFLAVGITVEADEVRLCVADRGPGLAASSPADGAGLGLTTVALMARELGLRWTITSDAGGTVCRLSGPAHLAP